MREPPRLIEQAEAGQMGCYRRCHSVRERESEEGIWFAVGSAVWEDTMNFRLSLPERVSAGCRRESDSEMKMKNRAMGSRS